MIYNLILSRYEGPTKSLEGNLMRSGTEERIQEAQSLIEQGMPIITACKKANTSPMTYRKFQKQGLITNPKPRKNRPSKVMTFIPEPIADETMTVYIVKMTRSQFKELL